MPVTSPAILDDLIDVIGRPAIMKRARRNLVQLAAFHRWVERKSEVEVLRMPGHRPVQIVAPRAFLRLPGR